MARNALTSRNAILDPKYTGRRIPLPAHRMVSGMNSPTAVAEGFQNTNTQGATETIRAKRRERLRAKLTKQRKTPEQIEQAIREAGLE